MNGSALITVFIFFLVVVWFLFHWLWKKAEAANGADWGGKWRNRIDGLIRLFLKHHHDYQYELVPLPETGAAIVIGNHVSGVDPWMMSSACNRPVRFLISKDEYERFGLNWLFRLAGCIPVDRTNRDNTAFTAALEALERGEIVGLFPHGKIQIPGEPPLRIRRGVARLAKLSGAPVYPLYFSGVKAKGHVIRGVLIPGKLRMQTFSPLDCVSIDESDCLANITKILNKSET
jgi:1-acyl-sn-glycerol-3-phosphate acyltransferase